VPIDSASHTLLDVMLILGKYACHRAWLVQSPGGDIINVISQTGVVCTLTFFPLMLIRPACSHPCEHEDLLLRPDVQDGG
jgi:hypothetical protein